MPPVDRTAPCPCGSGRRYKSCCFPRDRARADMAQTAAAAHAEIDAAVDALIPLVPQTGDHSVACHAGCSACCTQLIRLTWPEALRIAEWLLDPARQEVLARFESLLGPWRERNGDLVPIIEEILARAGGAPREEPDVGRYVEASLEYQRRGFQCPFNDEAGLCAIYPVRPLPCRVTVALDTAEYCSPDRGRGPTLLRTTEMQAQVYALRKRVVDSAAKNTRKPVERSLPSFVAEALATLRRAEP